MNGNVNGAWMVAYRCLFLPRSEHWITRRWHWHLKGHLGPSGTGGRNLGAGDISPDPASSSIMKSRKPDWRKGRAQQAVTRSRERQADLMALLAGSLRTRGHSSKVWVETLKTVCLWLVCKLLWVTICFWFTVIIERKRKEGKIDFRTGSDSKADRGDAAWERQNKRHWREVQRGKGQRWKVEGRGLESSTLGCNNLVTLA